MNTDKTKLYTDNDDNTNTSRPTPTMKVTINSFRAVATWKWDLPEESDDTCGICRVNFEGTCSKCKFPGDDCPIIVGECRHCFHMVCLDLV
jgi:anaphase-promoting complex subunit 11